MVLRPITPMMTKKNTNDTMRKNVLRSPVIMMTHLLFSQEKPYTRKPSRAYHEVGDGHDLADQLTEYDEIILPILTSLHCCGFITTL